MPDYVSPPVFMFDDRDPEMQRAYEQARANFKYFWREVAWERKRIIPALDITSVKAPFADVSKANNSDDTPEVEHMWLSDIDFDGVYVTGELMNSPNAIKGLKQGDSARFRLDQISDWIYAINDEVYGAYTVNLIRSRMAPQERKAHDEAWGRNFGDPTTIRIVSEDQHQAMCEAVAPALEEQLKKTPTLVSATGRNGWTLLHQDASAGSLATVKILLAAGADPHAPSDNGMTPVQLAEVLGWDAMVALLTGR